MSGVVPHLIFEQGDEPCVCRTATINRAGLHEEDV